MIINLKGFGTHTHKYFDYFKIMLEVSKGAKTI